MPSSLVSPFSIYYHNFVSVLLSAFSVISTTGSPIGAILDQPWIGLTRDLSILFPYLPYYWSDGTAWPDYDNWVPLVGMTPENLPNPAPLCVQVCKSIT